MKKYEKFASAEIMLLPRSNNKDYVVVKDIINECIITSKHVNYINTIGLELYVPYKVELGIYTNEKDGKYYTEYDFLKGKIYGYNPIQSGKFASVKKSEKPSKTTANKPAWIK